MRRQTIKERVAPALVALLEPGDQLVAGFEAQTGISPNWEALWARAWIVPGIVGAWHLWFRATAAPSVKAGFFLFGLPAIAAAGFLGLGLRSKHLFFVVSERFLICYE